MKTVVFVYLALIVLAMSSCQKKDDNNTARVPDMSADCVNNPQLCQNGLYQQNPGFYNYNQNYAYSNNLSSLCSCPYGTMPTYNNYAGLGCVQSNQIYGGGYAYFTWNAGGYGGVYGNAYAGAGYGNGYGYGNNGYANSWTNTPQISNIGGSYSNSCYNGVVQSCLVGQGNTCSAGYTCRPSAASSRLGLCVSNYNNTNTNYGQNYR